MGGNSTTGQRIGFWKAQEDRPDLGMAEESSWTRGLCTQGMGTDLRTTTQSNLSLCPTLPSPPSILSHEGGTHTWITVHPRRQRSKELYIRGTTCVTYQEMKLVHLGLIIEGEQEMGRPNGHVRADPRQAKVSVSGRVRVSGSSLRHSTIRLSLLSFWNMSIIGLYGGSARESLLAR